MNDKELLNQLHSLKEIKPDMEWKNSHRDILLSQISSGAGVEEKSFIRKTMNIFAWRNLEWVTQPAGVMAAIIIFVFGGTMASVVASKNTVPGDSFYIAKILSERTKQAMTFGETEKARLGIEFAGNRAQEISQVTEGTNVEKLESDFKNEIKTVRTRLDKISAKKDASPSQEEDQVFSADSGKDDNGIQVSDSSVSAPYQAPVSANVILDEAVKLFDEKDYQGTVDKLNEANAVIEQSQEEDGQADPAATSTK